MNNSANNIEDPNIYSYNQQVDNMLTKIVPLLNKTAGSKNEYHPQLYSKIDYT